jgi:hypothetical protein
VVTWDDVKKHLRGKFQIMQEDHAYVVLNFALHQNRSQRIVISSFEAMNHRWLLYRSRICERARLDPEEALRRNSSFAVGFLALSEGFYEVVYTLQMDTLEVDELEIPIYALVDTADQLERELTGSDTW